ncbi:MAG: DNA-binding response regulator [Comamonadaceae bacterium]|nr:MAG: DNA-binding response regulator [Comamonadaceae bacterium]
MQDVLNRAGQGESVLMVGRNATFRKELHETIEDAGYTARIAISGAEAMRHALQSVPDIVLLDADLGDMDGFELARQFKVLAHTAHVPLIFVTDANAPENLVRALASGGADCVTHPVQPLEVLARMGLHLAGARERRQTRNALDAFGYATMTVRANDGKLMWQTALARGLLERYCPDHPPYASHAAPEIQEWLQACLRQLQRTEPPRALTLSLEGGASRLTLRLHQQTGDKSSENVSEEDQQADDWLIVMREVSDKAILDAMRLGFSLTAREAQVLYWVSKGKTNKDIGDILESSPMTVKKHLERVFVKLGVETRTAAAGKVAAHIPQMQ